MALLLATPLEALGISKVIVDWLPYTNDLVSVYRILPDGSEVEVIGSPVQLSGGKAILYDTVAPVDVALHYRAELPESVVLRDDFSRVATDSWGSPTFAATGASWVNTGGAGTDYDVASNRGTHTNTTVNVSRRSTLTAGGYTDVRMEATTWLEATPTGAPISSGLHTRYVDSSNHYVFGVAFNPGGSVTASISKVVAGTFSVIASKTTTLGFAANQRYRMVGESVGTRHRMKVWSSESDVSPSEWTLEVVDSSFASGGLALRSTRSTGNTNTNPVISFDDVVAVNLVKQTISTTQAATISAAPHGWIRDPLVPARSVLLDNCSTHTFECLNAENFVFFRGLGGEQYESASGVFGVLNAARPVVVSQTRKDLTTELRFVSTTLNDILRVRTLFSPGRPLSLSLSPEYGWGLDSYGTAMFAALDVSAGRVNNRDMRKPYREWSVPLAVTDLDDNASDGWLGGNNIPIPGATYADMTATGQTYLQLRTVAASPEVTDTFTGRTVANGFGVAELGGTWVVASGGASSFSVSGGKGNIAHTVVNAPRRIVVGNLQANSRGFANFGITVTPTGGPVYFGLMARYIDINNYVLFLGEISTAGLVSGSIYSRVAGVDTLLAGPVSTGITHVPGTSYSMRYETNANVAYLKLYVFGTSEPGSQLATATIANPEINGAFGVYTSLDALNGDSLPQTITVDSVSINYNVRTYLDWAQGVYA